MFRKVLNTR